MWIKRERNDEFKTIWAKRLPFKVTFYMWKTLRIKFAIDDNLKWMRIDVVSMCWCCDTKKEEIIEHYFNSPIDEMLWRQFAIFCTYCHWGDKVTSDYSNMVDYESGSKNKYYILSYTSNYHVVFMKKKEWNQTWEDNKFHRLI